MPRVPGAPLPSVAPEPLREARLDPSAGQGRARALEGVGRAVAVAAGQLGEFASDMKARAVQYATWNATNTLGDRGLDLFGDLQKVKGKGSIEAAEGFREQMREQLDAAAETISDPAAREAWILQTATPTLRRFELDVERYVRREMDEYAAQGFTGSLDRLHRTAVHRRSDPDAVTDSAVEAARTIAQYAETEGVHPDKRDSMIAEWNQGMYADVLQGLLQDAQDDPTAVGRAREAFGEFEPFLDATVASRASRVLDALDRSNRIHETNGRLWDDVAGDVPTASQMREHLAEIDREKDATTREAMREDYYSRVRAGEAIERAAQHEAFNVIWDSVELGRITTMNDLHKMPSYVRLDADLQARVRSLVASNASGDSAQETHPKFFDMINAEYLNRQVKLPDGTAQSRASTPEEMAAFPVEMFFDLASPSEQKWLLTHRQKYRDQVARGDATPMPSGNASAALKRRLIQDNLFQKTSTTNSGVVAYMEEQAKLQELELTQELGRRPTEAEVLERIVEPMLSRRLDIEQTHWWGSDYEDVPAGAVGYYARSGSLDLTKPTTIARATEITDMERQILEKWAKTQAPPQYRIRPTDTLPESQAREFLGDFILNPRAYPGLAEMLSLGEDAIGTAEDLFLEEHESDRAGKIRSDFERTAGRPPEEEELIELTEMAIDQEIRQFAHAVSADMPGRSHRGETVGSDDMRRRVRERIHELRQRGIDDPDVRRRLGLMDESVFRQFVPEWPGPMMPTVSRLPRSGR